MKNKKGFTLIEIIAVIIIIGIILIIAIPMVTKYISSSDRTAFASNVQAYAETVRGEYEMSEYGDLLLDNELMIVPMEYIKLEKGDEGKSPFGMYDYEKSYFLIVPEKKSYSFYATVVDETGVGVKLRKSSELGKEVVEDEIGEDLDEYALYTSGSVLLTFEGRSYEKCDTRDMERPDYTDDDGVVYVFCDLSSAVVDSVALVAKKKDSGETVYSGEWTNEGLNFTFTSTGISTNVYYCKDTTNTCTPNRVGRTGEKITLFNADQGTYYIRYKSVGDDPSQSVIKSFEANVDSTPPTCKLKATGTKNATGTAFLTDVLVEFETADDAHSGVSRYGLGSITGEQVATHTANSSNSVSYIGYIEDKVGNTNTCSISFVKNVELTITYMNKGGAGCSTKVVVFDQPYGALCTPSRTGYTFSGWYAEDTLETPVTNSSIVSTTADHSLYAKWTPNPYTIEIGLVKCAAWTSDKCTGTSVSLSGSNCSKVVIYDTAYQPLPQPNPITGYHFDSWYTAASGGTKITDTTILTNASNHTVYARCLPNQYTVTFNRNYSGGGSSTKTVTFDSTYGTLPSPSRSGYKFDGWYTASSGGSQVKNTTKVTRAENHTLYAHWTANPPPAPSGGCCPGKYCNVCWGCTKAGPFPYTNNQKAKAACGGKSAAKTTCTTNGTHCPN